jgi:hypothetical protein
MEKLMKENNKLGMICAWVSNGSGGIVLMPVGISGLERLGKNPPCF